MPFDVFGTRIPQELYVLSLSWLPLRHARLLLTDEPPAHDYTLFTLIFMTFLFCRFRLVLWI